MKEPSRSPGTSVPTQSNGLGMGIPVVLGASGKSSSTTQSAISGGAITIRDEAGQKQLTGKTAAEMVASLNRDTTNTLNALKPIFDKEKIEAGFEIAGEFTRQAGQFLTNRAKEASDLEQAMKAETDKTRKAELAEQYAQALEWGPGGTYRQILTAITAAAGGNVTGGAGQFVQSAAVNYLQSLGAEQIKAMAPSLGGEGSPAHTALQALLACGGASAQGGSCGAGALGASASVIFNTLAEAATGRDNDTLDSPEREARLNLLTSLVAGIGGALDPASAAQMATAARIEGENNALFLLAAPALIDAAVAGSATAVRMCATNPVCQAKAVAYLGSAVAAALGLVVATTDLVLPGQPADPVPPPGPITTPADQQVDTNVPGQPGTPADPIAVPGQENNGGQGGTVISTPAEQPAGPEVIFSEGAGSSDPVAMINGVKVVDRQKGVVYEGTVDLQPTLDRIESGVKYPSRNDGSVFNNAEGLLPIRPSGYYAEYVVPTPGIDGVGPQRVVIGKAGEVYYTPDHYSTFIPIKR